MATFLPPAPPPPPPPPPAPSIAARLMRGAAAALAAMIERQLAMMERHVRKERMRRTGRRDPEEGYWAELDRLLAHHGQALRILSAELRAQAASLEPPDAPVPLFPHRDPRDA